MGLFFLLLLVFYVKVIYADWQKLPYGLAGKSIPKLARILCIIDSFDAMTTERPYQKTKTIKEGIAELRACSGKQFDSDFVEPFIEMVEQLIHIQIKYCQHVPLRCIGRAK
jgi:response regulator RpfG family c-di-GMP phosphodiesterase